VDITNLNIPVAIFGSLLSAVAGAAGSWAVMKRRLDELARQGVDHERRLGELSDHREKHALDLQAVRQDLEYMTKAVHRIETMLERLLTRGRDDNQ
jgi:Tfp pilus assembly protein PilO